MSLSSETLLHRIPELDLGVQSNGEVIFFIAGRECRGGPNSLALLDVFRYPQTLGSAVAELAPRVAGVLAVEDILSDVVHLVRIGALRQGEPNPAFSERPYPFGFYDSPGVHIRILDDTKRRHAFLEAVRSVVRPGDVVLDLGTGTGILAVAAVQAGARHVYALEPSNMSAFARHVFRDNGVESRVTLIEDWSQNVLLPERADVLTYDVVGPQGLDMSISEITSDAVARHLTADCRLIPHRIDFGVQLVEVPAELASQYAFTDESTQRWRERFGIDFSALPRNHQEKVCPVFLPPHEAAQLRTLSEPEVLWSLDLITASEIPIESVVKEIRANADGEWVGAVGFTTISLGNSIRYSARPDDCGESPHWMTPLWFRTVPRPVTSGERVGCRYEYHGRGRVDVQVT